MPTYGRPETAKDYPPTTRILALNGLIAGVEKELAALKATRTEALKGCNHHFVPASEAADTLEPTLCSGVAYAGYNSGTGHRTDRLLRLDCTRCNEHEVTSLGIHCPICASELAWTYGDTETEWPTYFKHRTEVYCALLHLSCPCGF